LNDICERCHEPLDPDREGCEPGLCAGCTDILNGDDDPDEDEDIVASQADVRCPDCAGRRLYLTTYRDMVPDIMLTCRDCNSDFEIGDLPPYEG
jgi:DNA-directed RNA polymerase subunit RPC12/RpoP